MVNGHRKAQPAEGSTISSRQGALNSTAKKHLYEQACLHLFLSVPFSYF